MDIEADLGDTVRAREYFVGDLIHAEFNGVAHGRVVDYRRTLDDNGHVSALCFQKFDKFPVEDYLPAVVADENRSLSEFFYPVAVVDAEPLLKFVLEEAREIIGDHMLLRSEIKSVGDYRRQRTVAECREAFADVGKNLFSLDICPLFNLHVRVDMLNHAAGKPVNAA